MNLDKMAEWAEKYCNAETEWVDGIWYISSSWMTGACADVWFETGDNDLRLLEGWKAAAMKTQRRCYTLKSYSDSVFQIELEQGTKDGWTDWNSGKPKTRQQAVYEAMEKAHE